MLDGVAQCGKRAIGPLRHFVVLDDAQIGIDRVEFRAVGREVMEDDALLPQGMAGREHSWRGISSGKAISGTITN